MDKVAEIINAADVLRPKYDWRPEMVRIAKSLRDKAVVSANYAQNDGALNTQIAWDAVAALMDYVKYVVEQRIGSSV